jgi:hypothetical protein
MTPVNILFIVLALCVIAFVVIIAYLTYHIVEVTKSLKNILEDVQDITDDVKDTKNFIKHSIVRNVIEIGRTFFQSKYEQKRKTARHSS